MVSKARDQLALDEKVITVPELEAALEDRELRRQNLSDARVAFEAAHKVVEPMVEKLDLAVGTAVRVGRFRITRTMTAPRSVSFDALAKERTSIKLASEE